MAQPLSANKRITSPIVINDFETAGKDCSMSPVTEFAAVSIHPETFQEIARCQFLFKPHFHPELNFYDPEALEITGITMELLEKEGLPFPEAFNQIISFLTKSNINGCGIASKNRLTQSKGGKKMQSTKNQAVMSGHNILFDHGFWQQIFFVAKEMGICTFDYDDFFAGQYDLYGNFIPEMIDTFPLAKTYFSNKDTKNHRLGTFAQALNIELTGAHRALNDVLGSTEIYRTLASKIRDGNVEQNRVRNHFKF